jgi:uncharacterized RDD family membrane protein YckC
MPDRDTAHQPNPLPPKARSFQGLRAGVVSRTIAGAVDYGLVLALTLGSWLAYVVLLFLLDPRDFVVPTWPFFTYLVIGFSLLVSYLAISFATTGRTLGDRLMGLRVVGRKGNRIRWWTAVLRAVFCAVFPVGLFWCAVSRENRSVQDVVLRSSVIHEWPVPVEVPVLTDVDRRSDLS